MDDTRIGRQTIRSALREVIPLCLTLLLLGGCLAGGSGGGPSTVTSATTTTSAPSPSPSPSAPAALDSTLSAYLRADNRTRYAERHGLTVEDGRVRVVIGLRDGATLPAGFDIAIELRHGAEVLAYVETAGLAGLARHRNVTVVRVPDRPRPQGGNASVESAVVAPSESRRRVSHRS